MSRTALRVLLPLVLAALVLGAFLIADPLRSFDSGAPPAEALTVERTVINDAGITLLVRAGGAVPIEIAQVQVDGAYWTFVQDPPGPLPRLSGAALRIPYPWVFGETHHVVMLTRSGVPIEHTIEVAVPAPSGAWSMLTAYGLVGLFVGVVPVALGMLFFPALRAGGAGTFAFALALTVGLLLFLLVDTIGEALEFAAAAAPELKLPALVWLVAGLVFAVLFAVGRRGGGALAGPALATAIALGIGLHNLGEGLAIGAAFATGAAALGSFLVLGFTLHNITEGIGIVAPLVRRPPRVWLMARLALLAGLPAVLGVWLGSYAFAPHWAALALAVGAGAILQVVVEVVGMLLSDRAAAGSGSTASAPTVAGLALGVAVMYGTALLVQI